MRPDGSQGRSPEIGGDRYGKERCRTLDIAARIVFGVSVMDRQISEYLVDKRKRETGGGEHTKYVRKVHKMDFGARMEMARKYGMGKNSGTLLDDIRAVRVVRNAIAHSTVGVNAGGTVAISNGEIDRVVGSPTGYSVDALLETLKKTELCNSRLRAAFRHSRKRKFEDGGA